MGESYDDFFLGGKPDFTFSVLGASVLSFDFFSVNSPVAISAMNFALCMKSFGNFNLSILQRYEIFELLAGEIS